MQTRTWLAIVALVAGCGSSSSGTSADASTMGTDGAVATGDSAAAGSDVASGGADAGPMGDLAEMTNQEWCQAACTKLAGCGVAYDATCATNCLMAPTFLACVKRSAQECNALALCTFEQASALFCGDQTTAYPSGTGTCAAAAMCEGLCT